MNNIGGLAILPSWRGKRSLGRCGAHHSTRKWRTIGTRSFLQGSDVDERTRAGILGVRPIKQSAGGTASPSGDLFSMPGSLPPSFADSGVLFQSLNFMKFTKSTKKRESVKIHSS